MQLLPCKYCGGAYAVPSMVTSFACDDCALDLKDGIRVSDLIYRGQCLEDGAISRAAHRNQPYNTSNIRRWLKRGLREARGF